MLELKHVSFEVEGKHILNDITMTIADNQFTVITLSLIHIQMCIRDRQEASSLAIAHSKANRLNELIDEFSEVLRYDDKVSQLDVTCLLYTSI